MSMLDKGYYRLLQLLNSGEELTSLEFAERLSVTTRTIQRWMKRARADGISIVHRRKNRGKVFSIPEEHRETGLWISLDQNELLALVVAADASQGTLSRTPLGPSLEEAIRKLIGQMPDELIPIEAEESELYWHFSGNPASEIDPAVFRDLVGAIRDCAVILVDYYSASSGRSQSARPLEPYALALQAGSWLLVAWCHRQKAFRDFSIAAISNLQRAGTFFSRKEDFDLDAHFCGRFRAVGGTRSYAIKLLIESDRLPYFMRKCYHPSQELTQLEDGRTIAEYTVLGLDDIRSFAQSWGVGITVLEPPELVAIMRAEANTLAERYNQLSTHM